MSTPFEGSETSVGRIGLAFSFGLYAYSGWDTMNTAVEEMQRPNFVLPISIILSVIVVTVAYLLVNIAYFVVLDLDDIMGTDAVAVIFAQRFFPAGAWFMSVLVGISAIGACNAALFQVSRFYFAIAREGQLPRFLATIHPKSNAPLPAIITTTMLILLCLLSDNIYQLLAYYGILKWSMVALPVAAQIRLRYKYPNIHRPLKFPLVLPVVTLCVLVALLVVPIYENWRNSLFAFLLSCLCIPVYLFFFHFRHPPSLARALRHIDNWLVEGTQKLLLVTFAVEHKHSNCALAAEHALVNGNYAKEEAIMETSTSSAQMMQDNITRNCGPTHKTNTKLTNGQSTNGRRATFY